MALLRLHEDGLNAQEIARRWGITVQGVRTQQSGLRRQVGVESLDEAVRLTRDTVARYEHLLPLDGRMLRNSKSQEHSIFTDRQREILKLVLRRHKAPRIARELGISQATVYVHLHQIRGRLGVSTDRAAAEKAVYLGFIEGDRTEDVPTLSPRQLALLKHISDGRTVRQIARLWKCAESCVHGVARQVRDRLATNDLNEAARLAEEQIKANLPGLPLTGRLRRPVDEGEGPALTRRQRQMLQGIREGLTYAQLGQRYGIAEPTVTGHLRKARDMLGAKRSLEAARRAEELGLL